MKIQPTQIERTKRHRRKVNTGNPTVKKSKRMNRVLTTGELSSSKFSPLSYRRMSVLSVSVLSVLSVLSVTVTVTVSVLAVRSTCL